MRDPLLSFLRGRRELRQFLRRYAPPFKAQPHLLARKAELSYRPGEELIAAVTLAETEDDDAEKTLSLFRFVPAGTPAAEGEELIYDDAGVFCYYCPFPTDGRLPGLAEALSPAYSAELQSRFTRGDRAPASGAGCAALSPAAPEVLSYSPHSRAVLRYGQGETALVGKLYESRETASRVWAALTHISAVAAGMDMTAEPLMLDDRLNMVVTRVAPGRTLDELLHTQDAADSHHEGLFRTAAALYRLHQLPAGGLEHVSLEGKDSGFELPASMVLEPAFETIVERANSLLERVGAIDVPGSERRLIHGGFKPPQVMLDGAAVRLVDLDGCGIGDPAWDIGRFMAKLRGDSIEDGQGEFQAYEDVFMAAYLGFADGDADAWASRVRRYQVLELVRMALSRLSTHPPGTFRFHKSDSRAFLQQAERVLNQAQR